RARSSPRCRCSTSTSTGRGGTWPPPGGGPSSGPRASSGGSTAASDPHRAATPRAPPGPLSSGAVAHGEEPAQRPDVRRAVGPDGDRGPVVVVAETRAGEEPVDGLAGAEVDGGEVVRVGPPRGVRQLRVEVEEPVAERELRHRRLRDLA